MHRPTPCARLLLIALAFIGLCGGVLLGGCASVVSGASQAVSVTVTCGGEVLPTACVLHNSRGRWTLQTPGQKTILRDASPLQLSCLSPSFGGHTQRYASTFNPLTAGNVLAGGVLGVGLDYSNSAMWRYPSDIRLESVYCRLAGA